MATPQHARRGETPAERRERHAQVGDLDEVVNAAARLLEARPRSVGEVRRRLIRAGYADPLVEAAIARLVGLGYLDDETFARAWVESRDRAHPRGERALRTELLTKGIARETVETILAERAPAVAAVDGRPDLSADDVAAARLLERHRCSLMREPDDRKRRQKAYALLARSGFDPETSRSVAATLSASLNAAGADGDPDRSDMP